MKVEAPCILTGQSKEANFCSVNLPFTWSVMKQLLIAAVVIALALSPSIAECVQAHEQDHPRKWVLWAWIALVVILAFTAGDVIMGGAS